MLRNPHSHPLLDLLLKPFPCLLCLEGLWTTLDYDIGAKSDVMVSNYQRQVTSEHTEAAQLRGPLNEHQ